MLLSIIKMEEERFCNQCLLKRPLPESAFDVGRKSCRDCLARRARKFNCDCGGKYTQGGISHHKNTKMHQEYVAQTGNEIPYKSNGGLLNDLIRDTA